MRLLLDNGYLIVDGSKVYSIPAGLVENNRIIKSKEFREFLTKTVKARWTSRNKLRVVYIPNNPNCDSFILNKTDLTDPRDTEYLFYKKLEDRKPMCTVKFFIEYKLEIDETGKCNVVMSNRDLINSLDETVGEDCYTADGSFQMMDIIEVQTLEGKAKSGVWVYVVFTTSQVFLTVQDLQNKDKYFSVNTMAYDSSNVQTIFKRVQSFISGIEETLRCKITGVAAGGMMVVTGVGLAFNRNCGDISGLENLMSFDLKAMDERAQDFIDNRQFLEERIAESVREHTESANTNTNYNSYSDEFEINI